MSRPLSPQGHENWDRIFKEPRCCEVGLIVDYNPSSGKITYAGGCQYWSADAKYGCGKDDRDCAKYHSFRKTETIIKKKT
jgi:hypothetical protein